MFATHSNFSPSKVVPLATHLPWKSQSGPSQPYFSPIPERNPFPSAPLTLSLVSDIKSRGYIKCSHRSSNVGKGTINTNPSPGVTWFLRSQRSHPFLYKWAIRRGSRLFAEPLSEGKLNIRFTYGMDIHKYIPSRGPLISNRHSGLFWKIVYKQTSCAGNQQSLAASATCKLVASVCRFANFFWEALRLGSQITGATSVRMTSTWTKLGASQTVSYYSDGQG